MMFMQVTCGSIVLVLGHYTLLKPNLAWLSKVLAEDFFTGRARRGGWLSGAK